jgi:cytochrome P460
MTRVGVLSTLVLALASGASNAAEPVLKFNDKGELQRPSDYREWVFLTAGLGMTYGPNAPRAGQPAPFSNVFVNPASYREFMQTGKWPNDTMFILEIRGALENVSINNGGRTQGDVVAIEAAVKDATRFPDGGWAYFGFDDRSGPKAAVAPFPRTASCYSCHSKNAAVEWSFTQFYPMQFEVAKRLGTVRADYDPNRKLEQ